jgi:hypothetical protein
MGNTPMFGNWVQIEMGIFLKTIQIDCNTFNFQL